MDKEKRIAFFHEDDYCQLEILPLTAKACCQKEMGLIDAFAEGHRVSGGFIDLYLRNGGPYKLTELALRPAQLDEALAFLSPYDCVETGYSSQRKMVKSACARGKGIGENVFWSVNEKELVNAIWLDLWITPETKAEWQNILIALGRSAPVLLADWAWSLCVNLTSSNEINQYVEAKANA